MGQAAVSDRRQRERCVNMGVNFVRDISYPNPTEKYGQAPIVSLYPVN